MITSSQFEISGQGASAGISPRDLECAYKKMKTRYSVNILITQRQLTSFVMVNMHFVELTH